MKNVTTLYNFAQRLVLNKRLLERNPDQYELLQRKINEAKISILEIVERNADNEILKSIK